MPPASRGELGICPVCGEVGRLFKFGERPLHHGYGDMQWVIGEALCRGCLDVVLQAADSGLLDLQQPLDGGETLS